MDVVLEVLKWIVLIFVAGVIGQFGKSLTLKILERRRRRKERDLASHAPPGRQPANTPQPPAAASADLLKQVAKAEKKARKAEVKRIKKAGRDK